MLRRPAIQLALLAAAILAAMTLWFSATAVLPALEARWQLGAGGKAWLTGAVQLGFVAGAVASAIGNFADLVPPRRLVAVCALTGALLNLLLAYLIDGLPAALLLRFLTGVCLAGVYPPGMKIAAGHVPGRARGMAIGLLVGALTLGSATPHLVAGFEIGSSYRAVLTVSSALAVAGALVIATVVVDGPFAARTAPFDPSQIGATLRNRGVMLTNLGYCGHMWELYALWTWLVYFLLAADGLRGTRPGPVAFVAIGVAGAGGALVGGWLADRIGRTTLTIAAMATSAACCASSGWVAGATAPWLILFVSIWGAAAVADSAQFSAAVTELGDPRYVGTALTLQTALGFALTVVTIQGLPLLADVVGWRYAFVALAPGPLLGCVAMALLRRLPQAAQMAGGRR